ncbi:hypothetical protein GTP23_06475 [Pseudoduganella sp. FT93W]|uniref:Uncharacterized protein n=1 Tax=Duganella fentianensis TaxID=2692177 RepID=A0A845HUM1_9BURK|nr:hypothetical protein [Duganella fentianensis]MYN44719.1 hypothetical protein [Duganella fentianensis]
MKNLLGALLIVGSWAAQAQTSIPQIVPTPQGPAPQSLVLSNTAPPQFQLRRRIFNQVAHGVMRNDPAAAIALDKLLTDYESAAFRYTPLEALEIIGFYFLPREGMEKAFQVIVAEQVLGWYDVLRYASDSGREEIVNNEGFFKLPLVIGGPRVGALAAKYFDEHPAHARAMLDRGFASADSWRETLNYDRHWPSYYGLERLICLQDSTTCKPTPELDRSKWNAAWNEAKQRVAAYYQLDKPLLK